MVYFFFIKNNGVNCMKLESFFIGNCDYDVVGVMFFYFVEDVLIFDELLLG